MYLSVLLLMDIWVVAVQGYELYNCTSQIMPIVSHWYVIKLVSSFLHPRVSDTAFDSGVQPWWPRSTIHICNYSAKFDLSTAHTHPAYSPLVGGLGSGNGLGPGSPLSITFIYACEQRPQTSRLIWQQCQQEILRKHHIFHLESSLRLKILPLFPLAW